MTAQGMAERLGGWRVLALEIRTDLDLVDAIEGGLPIEAVETVIEDGTLTQQEIYDLVIPRRTLAHRKQKGQRLTAEQSDRLARAVRVAARAEEAVGDREKAARWLRRPNRALGGRRPFDLVESGLGARMVEQELGRLEHGIVA